MVISRRTFPREELAEMLKSTIGTPYTKIGDNGASAMLFRREEIPELVPDDSDGDAAANVDCDTLSYSSSVDSTDGFLMNHFEEGFSGDGTRDLASMPTRGDAHALPLQTVDVGN